MPVNKSLAKSLKKKYGSKKGESIYYAMENSGSKSFKKGLKNATKEGHTLKKFPKGKK
jgi:hypothetical protein